MTAEKLNPLQRELLQAAFDLGVAVLGQDGEIIVVPELVAELRLNRRLEGRDLVTGALPPAEIVDVWCVNDDRNAVGVVDGESYCGTCIVYASAVR